MKIRTSYDYPPIPDRSMDWSAIDDHTYDCDCDQDGFFSLSPIGHGRTEADAITDLLEKMEDTMPKTEAAVSAVMLRRSGEHAIVEIEIGGEWFEIIREHLEGNFSHIAEAVGFTRKRSELQTESPDAPPHD
jgi:hypothetical protein